MKAYIVKAKNVESEECLVIAEDKDGAVLHFMNEYYYAEIVSVEPVTENMTVELGGFF